MSRTAPSQRLLTTATLLLTVATGVQAGPIFLRGHVADGKFVAPAVDATGPDAGAAELPLGYGIRYATVNATVLADGSTTIEAEEIIHGPRQGEKTVCIVPLPIGLADGTLAIAAGTSSKSRRSLAGVRVLDVPAARTFLEEIVRGTGDVGFAALTGRPIAVVDEYELVHRSNFLITYQECNVPSEKDGITRIALPLPRTQWTNAPVEQLSITTRIASVEPLRAMFSPSHVTKVERDSLFEAIARVRSTDVLCDDDYRLVWAADEQDLGLRVLPFRMDGEDDGYFMLVANPTGRPDGSDELEKDVTFVLDTSGSMRGEKIEQCRAAISYCLDQLAEGDRFNIVTFGTEVQPFRRGLVPSTSQNVNAARDFVDEIVAMGRTNIDGALRAALAGRATEGRPRITIFLTDGTPTAGELVPAKILEAATKSNVSKSSVYVLGVGHDVNVHLLDKLAEQTEGAAEFVEPEEDIDVKVAGLYDRLAHPVLTDVVVEFGDLETHSLFPRKLPAMYRNSEVMLFGRYRDGGTATVKVTGTLAGEPREFSLDITSPEKANGNANDFVAPLWATRKIGYLLQEMRLHGEDAELLEEIVRLSKKYGIITEYTQFVAMRSGVVTRGGARFDGDQFAQAKRRLAFGANANGAQGAIGGGFGNEAVDFAQLNRNAFRDRLAGPAPAAPGVAFEALDEKAAVAEVTRQIALARKQETGRWAFNQAKNDKELQNRTVATGAANSYVDRRGNRVALDQFVKHVGGRCFFLKDGQWCESEEAGERKERVIELYSDEYFTLLKENEDFRRAQKLGWAISINVGDERVVVEKDGQRSDLPEAPQPEEQSAPNVGPVPPQQNVLPPNVDEQIRGLQQQKIEGLNDVRQRVPGGGR